MAVLQIKIRIYSNQQAISIYQVTMQNQENKIAIQLFC